MAGAGGAVIGALRVVLGADTATFEKGLKEAQASLSGFAIDIAKAGAVITAAVTAAYSAVALGVNSTLKQMDDFAKQSQKIGIPVEQLSSLKLAADLSGVSMEQLGKGVAKLSKQMVDAAAKPTGEAADAFKALGVSVTDSAGKLRPTNDVLTAIAGKFEGLKDGAGKTAVAIALFGKSGADLIPLLNSGASGLQGMIENAQKFGIVVSTDSAKAAEKFRDTLTLLGAAKDGIIVKLTQHMLPALQAFADLMVKSASDADKQQNKLNILKTAFDALARGVLLVADNFKIVLQVGALFVGASIGAAVISMGLAFSKLALAVYTTGVAMTLFNAIRALSMRGILLIAGALALVTGNFDTLKEKLTDIGTTFTKMLPDEGGGGMVGFLKDLGINIRALEVDLTKMGATAGGSAAAGLKDFNYAALAGKTALDNFLDTQKKSLAGHQAEAQAVLLGVGAKERLKVVLEAYQVAASNAIKITDPLRAKISGLGNDAEQAALKLRGAQITQEMMTPAQQYIFQMTEIGRLLAVNAISQQTFNAKVAAMAAPQLTTMINDFSNLGKMIDDIAASAINKMVSGIGDVVMGTKKAADAIKEFGAALIRMIVEMTAKMLIALPIAIALKAAISSIIPGAGLFLGGGMFFGMKDGGVIDVPGFAGGTAFRVPGGIGGGDKVFTPMMLEPGERVQVSSNNTDGYQADRAGGSRIVVPLTGRMFDRDTIIEWIGAINKVQKDGPRIELATA